MESSWYSEFVFQVVVHKRFVDEATLAVLETPPRVLPPWDPMGALAPPPCEDATCRL
jgi:bleomycin hydrolase